MHLSTAGSRKESSRFSDSLGVFQTARQLMRTVEKYTLGNREEQKKHMAIVAALVHDVGHGPFSHAFEDVGKRLKLNLANHEEMSYRLIRDGEITGILKEYGNGFHDDVANILKKDGNKTVYNAVVSSQFDAERFNYMRRDRLMTGNGHSTVHFELARKDALLGELRETKETASWGGEYSIYVVDMEPDENCPPGRGELASKAANSDVIILELAAPAVFLQLEYDERDPWAETAEMLPGPARQGEGTA